MAPFGDWVKYFIGTPQRFMRTLVVIMVVTVMIKPSLLEKAMTNLAIAVQPLIAPVLTLLIVFAGLRIVLGGFNKSGKGKN